MLVKRYRAADMPQAMDVIKRELGSDAVILDSRKVKKKGLRYIFTKPDLEVMVAYEPDKIPSARKFSQKQQSLPDKRDSSPASQQKKGSAQTNFSDDRFELLDKRIDSLDKMISNFINKFSYVKRDITNDYSDDVEELFMKLVENQVREELAHSIAKETETIMKKQPGVPAREVMEQLIIEQLRQPEPIVHRKFKQKVVLVMGPTGVGKTTSIVKLAANFTLKHKKKVGIINTDTYRIGAQEQLKTYADILDIPLSVVYQTDEISDAIDNLSDRDIIFIDTAGKKPGDEQHKSELLDIIRLTQPEDILLCVAASTAFSSVKEILDNYAFVAGYKLLVTKIDETKYHGSILNISWYADCPLAYFTNGQNVPDDLELIDVGQVCARILR
jgi:flagellar biosynthesis protein FlhF